MPAVQALAPEKWVVGFITRLFGDHGRCELPVMSGFDQVHGAVSISELN
jgi:hypothetical protein